MGLNGSSMNVDSIVFTSRHLKRFLIACVTGFEETTSEAIKKVIETALGEYCVLSVYHPPQDRLIAYVALCGNEDDVDSNGKNLLKLCWNIFWYIGFNEMTLLHTDATTLLCPSPRCARRWSARRRWSRLNYVSPLCVVIFCCILCELFNPACEISAFAVVESFEFVDDIIDTFKKSFFF